MSTCHHLTHGCYFSSCTISLLCIFLCLDYLLLPPLSAWKSRLQLLPSYWPASSLLNQSQNIFSQCANIPQFFNVCMWRPENDWEVGSLPSLCGPRIKLRQFSLTKCPHPLGSLPNLLVLPFVSLALIYGDTKGAEEIFFSLFFICYALIFK